MVLSILLLGFFIIFGATFFGATAFIVGIFDYLVALPWLSFNVYTSDGVEGSVAAKLEQWQGWWPVFYWAWWIAFAPFVGLFLARISRGRSIREFVLGAMIVPSLMCFVWFAWAGGTAIDLELNGDANGLILNAANGDKIFAMTEFMLSPVSEALAWGMAVMIVVLLLTFLVTSADSAVLIVNTINAAGRGRWIVDFRRYRSNPNRDGDRRIAILHCYGTYVHCPNQSHLERWSPRGSWYCIGHNKHRLGSSSSRIKMNGTL